MLRDLTAGWRAESKLGRTTWRRCRNARTRESLFSNSRLKLISSGKSVTGVFNLGMAVFGNLIGFCYCFDTSSYCVDLAGLGLDI